MIYLIGSMRNARILQVSGELRKAGWEIFDDWFSPGPQADDEWQRYEQMRGRNYPEALAGEHAKTVFEFDKRHLDACEAAVLVLPAGKSGHMELGYVIGQNKPGFILLHGEPDRFDVMYKFATQVCRDVQELKEALSVNLLPF